MSEVSPADTYCAEFETKWHWRFTHYAYQRIAFFVFSGCAIIWILHLLGTHNVLFWSISIIVVVISLIIILLIWLSFLVGLRGFVRINDGFITIRRTRYGKELYKIPYSWAQCISVGDIPVDYEGKRYVPVYLVVFTGEPYQEGTNRKWIFLFSMEHENKYVIAHINGKKHQFDRAKDSYMDVARALTRELCEYVSIDCRECGK